MTKRSKAKVQARRSSVKTFIKVRHCSNRTTATTPFTAGLGWGYCSCVPSQCSEAVCSSCRGRVLQHGAPQLFIAHQQCQPRLTQWPVKQQKPEHLVGATSAEQDGRMLGGQWQWGCSIGNSTACAPKHHSNGSRSCWGVWGPHWPTALGMVVRPSQ